VDPTARPSTAAGSPGVRRSDPGSL
jgi:hypothetical protein